MRDVLLSGGDALIFSDDKLDKLLSRLRAIRHIEFLRIGTRVPIFLPQRITPELCAMLQKHHPLWMSVHVNHPRELTSEVKDALERLANVGIPLPDGDSDSQFKSMLGSGTEVGGGVKVGTVADVDAGSAGGNVKCAPILASGGGDSKFVNCAWINGKSALVLTFQSYSADDARTLLPEILTAITKG